MKTNRAGLGWWVAAAAVLAAAAGVGTAAAEMRIPSSVFKLEELEEATAKATSADQPLIFVMTDPGTT